MEMSAEVTISVLENLIKHGRHNIPTKNAMENAVRLLKDKNGKWVSISEYGYGKGEQCSKCGYIHFGSVPCGWNFCPDCGASMGGEGSASVRTEEH